MKTLTLALMVKNESKVIERCLSSVKDIVDYMVIVDTGSTDNTIELVENFLINNHIKGEIRKKDWKNFGHNKIETINLAKSQADYILWMDADDVIINDKFDKNQLVDDAYYLRYDGNLDYVNLRIIKSNLNWNCVGVVHTYLDCKEAKQPFKELNTLKIKTFNDGSTDRDDVKLLLDALKAEPNNKRYHFYLAQSYKDKGDYNNAIIYYKKRIDLGGWEEEIFYSKYMIGFCYERLKEIEKAKSWYLSAYEFRPSRAEPLHKLIVLCRYLKEFNQAYLFAKKANEISYPKDLLFIEKQIYYFRILDELAIAAYWIKHYRECRQLCNILLKKELPKEDRIRIENNLKYAEKGIIN